MKTNLAILCLSNNYSRDFGKKIANFFDIFFVDVQDILEYNLINKDMLDSAGQDYFESQKQKVIDGIAQYENSLIVANINTFFENNNIQKFRENCLIVYLRLNKSVLEKIEQRYEIKNQFFAFEEEDLLCKNISDITIEIDDNDDKNLNIISNQFIEYFGGKKI